MVVPLILGKIAKDILDGKFVFTEDLAIPLGAGFIAAFLTGMLACTWMIQIVKKSQLSWFAGYCFLVGIAALVLG